MTAAAQASRNTSVGSALPTHAPCGTAGCPEGRIRIGIFFDGTGNNMWRDWGRSYQDRRRNELRAPTNSEINGPSNVAKLYQLFDDNGTTQKKIYIVGIGAGDQNSQPGQGDNLAAQATGYGGRDRIDRGMAELRTFVNTGNHQLAREKRVDVFGFSRGAAQARDFINKVNQLGIDNTSIPIGRAVQYVRRAGDAVPMPYLRPNARRTTGILFEFMGVFDTVGSFGPGASNPRNNPGYDFQVPGRPAQGTPAQVLAGNDVRAKEQWVHRTFHAVAEDEFREVFAVQLIAHDPKSRAFLRLPRNIREKPYPGAHSDIGGGYRNSPGRAAIPGRPVYTAGGMTMVGAQAAVPPSYSYLCNIPLEDMHREALRGHVPLRPLGNLPAIAYSVPGELRRLYNQYVVDRRRIVAAHVDSARLLADWTDEDLVFFHGLTRSAYRAIQGQRIETASFQALFRSYIHVSMTGGFRFISALARLFNPSRLLSVTRGHVHGGRQASYT